MATTIGLPHEIEADNAPVVDDQLRAVIESTSGLLVVDCSDLRFIDTVGMQALVRAQRLAEERGVRLVWSRLRDRPLELIQQSGLEHYLNLDARTDVDPRTEPVSWRGDAAPTATS
jgi:anti-anti-sigma factor